MAKLLIKSEGFHGKVLELNLGVNRFGRVEGNDFQIEHPTISAKHCEVILGDNQLIVRDCGSTNGTFIDGQPIGEARLSAGQTLRIGDVELLVETTEVNVAIPKFDTPHQGSPVVLSDGRLVCPRHKQALATHQCTHCRQVMCDECVHHLRRQGGKLLKLCPLCSHKVEEIGGVKKKKKTFLGFLQKTVKMPFLRSSRGDE
jgi:pSer/pThr/pTyr-binding forkhead associated (FHA) protein